MADFGAGSGAYSLALAHRVGTSGRVYAIDVQRELLARLKKTADEHSMRTIEIIHGNLDEVGGSKLRDSYVDAVLMSNVLFQSEHAKNMIAEAVRILKPAGQLLLIDWSESFGNLGPAAGHVVRESEARDYCERAGLELDKTEKAGDHHYGLLFHKPLR